VWHLVKHRDNFTFTFPWLRETDKVTKVPSHGIVLGFLPIMRLKKIVR